MIAERPIWLVGMMGAGKSAVGRALAARLSLSFVDSDHEIERREGCPVSEIFDHKGEAFFRAVESEVIGELSKAPGIVALGGGAAVQPGAIERLERSGTLVYLRATAESLFERIGDGESRPLLRGLEPHLRMERIVGLRRERDPSYSRARVVLDTDGKSIAELAQQIVDRIVKLDRESVRSTDS